MRAAVLTGIVMLLFLAAPVRAEPRLALVIGNSEYLSSPKLKNPVADARLLESKLQELGFEVTALMDLAHIPMRRALLEFTEKVASAGDGATALIYYSGHGVQVREQNYLVPVDAKLNRELDAEIEGLPLSGIISYLEAAQARTTIIILDACRDNPLRTAAKSAGKKGLARVTVPRGLYVGFAAGPGSTALDGAGVNSPFAASLARHITTPGLSIDQLFSRIRADVDTETQGHQIPRAESALIGEFFFRPDTATGAQDVAAATDSSSQPAVKRANRCAGGEDPSVLLQTAKEAGTFEAYTSLLRLCPDHPQKAKIEEARERAAEAAVWKLALQQDTKEGYEKYLIYYPAGEYSSGAREAVVRLDLRAESIAWSQAQTSGTESALRDYLARFPKGTYRSEAEEQLTRLLNAAPATTLPSAPAITTFVGFDLFGGDLQSMPMSSRDRCNEECGSTQKCVGYTFNTKYNVCILKARWHRAYRFGDAVSGIVEARAAGMPRPDESNPTFTLVRDVDLLGGDYDNVKGVTLTSCKEMCVGDAACRAFSYVPKYRWCWLKSGEAVRRPKANIVSGFKH
jgi:hypothetical protein